jgi:hypothetical protein
MTQEEKELLLKDLCARLPYGVKITWDGKNPLTVTPYIYCAITSEDNIDNIPKLLLRPMSSMTEEEKEELLNILPKYWGLEIDKLGDLYFDICDASYPDIELLTDIIDWLNKKMFDYRGLIKKGLALEAPEEMYNIKEK